MKKIHFYEINKKSYLKNKRGLKSFILDLFKNEGKGIDNIGFIFCSDKFLLSLNKSFLKHDYYTDTLSFTLSGQSQNIKGEIYISVDRVKDNAKKFHSTYQTELIRVMIHSSLHLCGYQDSDETAKHKMINHQETYINQWLVSRET